MALSVNFVGRSTNRLGQMQQHQQKWVFWIRDSDISQG